MRHLSALIIAASIYTSAAGQTPSGSYVFTTFAGRAGTTGSTDAVGTNARFNRPFGISLDSAGNVYVTEAVNHTVRKITPDGNVSTVAGQAGAVGFTDGVGSVARFGGDTSLFPEPAPAASPTGPYGIAVLPDGNLIVADGHYHVLRQITAAREVSLYAGTGRSAGTTDGPRAAAQFSLPVGVAADAAGVLFVADTGNHSIRRIAANGVVTTIAGRPGNWGNSDGTGEAGQFFYPTAIAVSAAGNVYVVDSGNTVRKLTRAFGSENTWEVTTLAGKSLTFGTADGTGEAARFSVNPSSTGAIVASYQSLVPPVGFASIFSASTAYNVGGLVGLAVDDTENVYVADYVSNTIRKVTPAGVVTTIGGSSTIAGSTDGVGTAARFFRPAGIAVDPSGVLYIADYLNNTIRKGGIARTPTVVSQTSSQTVGAGSNLSLVVTSSGYPTPTIQWARNGTTIAGATSTTLTIPNAQAANSGTYTATLTNVVGSVAITPIVLTVSSLPTFTLQPVSQTVVGGQPVTLRVTVVATPAPTYQWMLNGTPVSGATTATLVLTSAQAEQAGNYTVVVTNANGSSVSSAAAVQVNTGRLVNLSVRAALNAADPLIAGFVVSGGAKPLLVRAVGPGLRQFGVGTAMVDPQLSLQVGTTVISTNDNWSTSTSSAQVAAAAGQVGAFPLTASSLDAAVLASVTNNAVTAQTSARDSAGGVVLLELYDTGGVTAARLVNVSTRARVGVGENALFAGFSIGGNSPRTLLIRAIGPTLGSFGVTGVLADPLLEVFTAGVTTPRATNNDWSGDPALVATFTRVGAFPLPSGASKDAALIATFEPGTYSAKVSGVGNTTGEALLEVYEVP